MPRRLAFRQRKDLRHGRSEIHHGSVFRPAKQERCMVRIRTIVLVALLLPSLACAAQIPGLTSKPAAKSTPSANVPPDPLGRGTPHATVLGFLHAAQDENYSLPSQYSPPTTTHHPLPPTHEPH